MFKEHASFLASCLAYSLTLKIETVCISEIWENLYPGLCGITAQVFSIDANFGLCREWWWFWQEDRWRLC
jgi:hypothetical protein